MPPPDQDAHDSLRLLVDHSGEKGIGDIVCEQGFYAALRRRYPHATIASRKSRTLAWGNPLIDAFDETSPEETFDLVVRIDDLKPVTASLPAALKAARSVFDNFLHVQGFDPLAGPPELFVLPRELESLGLENDGEGGLVVAISADSKEPDRRWGEERFEALARYLETAHGASLIELGSGLSAGHLGVGYDMVGLTTLRETMAVLSLADLFVGNHGGLSHLAGALGTPILSPWGASHPYEAYAYDALSVAVQTAPACRNCGWTGLMLRECQDADLQRGRVPCTQAISVAAMAEACDRMVSTIQGVRLDLQARKAERRARAKDPLGLARFDRKHEVSPFTHQHLYLGGESGWGSAHRLDNFAQLRQIVAFPDWLGHPQAWQQLVSGFIADHDSSSPWVLTLGAHPLTGPEAWEVLEAFILQELKPQKTVPKIMVVLGTLSPEERADLAKRAERFVSLRPA